MELEILEKSWFKRRKPTKAAKPVSASVSGFAMRQDHFCQLHVLYEDGSSKTLLGRIIFNPLKNHWSIDAMEVAAIVKPAT